MFGDDVPNVRHHRQSGRSPRLRDRGSTPSPPRGEKARASEGSKAAVDGRPRPSQAPPPPPGGREGEKGGGGSFWEERTKLETETKTSPYPPRSFRAAATESRVSPPTELARPWAAAVEALVVVTTEQSSGKCCRKLAYSSSDGLWALVLNDSPRHRSAHDVRLWSEAYQGKTMVDAHRFRNMGGRVVRPDVVRPTISR